MWRTSAYNVTELPLLNPVWKWGGPLCELLPLALKRLTINLTNLGWRKAVIQNR